jgi:CheY-like chemotaxis protein
MSTTPNVYFIDDSATMREVIKIAFRRENMNVLACHDGVSALAQMEQNAPDVVISDVIMPGKDGYEVCQHIKQHPRFGRTPVILMSGVVNRAVAEKAFAVKADELIRKPFQPQDLIGRVRHLLNPLPAAAVVPPAAVSSANAVLSSIFAAPNSAAPGRPGNGQPAVPLSIPATVAARAAVVAAPAAVAVEAPVLHPQAPPAMPTRASVAAASASVSAGDAQKLRIEILRLQSQIKKLESELQAEREYAGALEEHIKTLQESD